MKKFIVGLFVLMVVACGGNETIDAQPDSEQTAQVAKGNKSYGGVLRINETDYFRTLFPPAYTDIFSSRIAQQVYQSLLKLNQENLSTEPCLAKSWSASEDGLVYTFNLRDDVYFHDDDCFPNGKGRKMVASDVKACFNNICDTKFSKMHSLFVGIVKGASEYYESTTYGEPLADGISGIKVIDDFTIQIKLIKPFAVFPKYMAMTQTSIYPPEALNTYSPDFMRAHCVGTGPFTLKNEQVREDESVFLKKNPNYWEKDQFGNTLPFLDGVKISFIREKRTEFMAFKNRELDMVFGVPVENVNDVLDDFRNAKNQDKFRTEVTDALNMTYLTFLNTDKLFSNPDVRKAFSLAIDKEYITEYIMSGEASPAIHGFVPKMDLYGYRNDTIKENSFNPEKARKLLSKAGYPNGKGLPQLVVRYNHGDLSDAVMKRVQHDLKKNLNIDITIKAAQLKRHMNLLEKGETNFFRFGWIADYPDAENYFRIFYWGDRALGDVEYDNVARFQNDTFDEFYEKAMTEQNTNKRLRLYYSMDSLLLKEIPAIPLYYETNIRLVKKYVEGVPPNGMEYRDLSRAFLKKKKINA